MRLSKVVAGELPLLSLHGAVVPEGKHNDCNDDHNNDAPIKRDGRLEFMKLKQQYVLIQTALNSTFA